MLCEVAPPKLAHENYSPGNSSGHLRTCDSLRRRFRVRRAVSTSHLAAGPRIQNLPKFSPPLFSPRQRPRIFPFSLPRLCGAAGTKGSERIVGCYLPKDGQGKIRIISCAATGTTLPPTRATAFLVVLRRGYDDDEQRHV